jgi:hypothetical protein
MSQETTVGRLVVAFVAGACATICLSCLGLLAHKYLSLGPGIETGKAFGSAVAMGGAAAVFWKLADGSR